MGSKKQKPRGLSIDGPFTPITNTEQDSVAYKELTGNAAKIFHRMVRVARTVALKLGSKSVHDVQFDFTYSEAKRHGFSESTTRRALQNLWEKGFISVIQIGGRTASKDCGRMSSKYSLAKFWQTYGTQWKDRTINEPDPWLLRSEPKSNEAPRW